MWARERDALPVEANLTGERAVRVHASEDLDERGFSGAVLAAQADDLASVGAEAHVPQHVDPAKALGYADQLEQGCGRKDAVRNRIPTRTPSRIRVSPSHGRETSIQHR